jgi:predicted RNA methylase
VSLSLLGELEKRLIGFLFSSYIPSAYNANKLYGLNKDYVEYQPVSLVKSIFMIKELKKLEKENSQINIIDVGSGTGLLIKVLSVFNFRNLVGVEIDEELCQIARNNFEDEILENRILFLNQDVLDLSLDWKFPVI